MPKEGYDYFLKILQGRNATILKTPNDNWGFPPHIPRRYLW